MVKHPRYQAMDNARQDAIPNVFEKYCNSEYKLQRVEPKIEEEPKVGPIPRPSFHVFKDEIRIAVFYPSGFTECFQDDFRETFEKMIEDIERIAQEALTQFEKDYPNR